ncbi:MAG TPA: M56 family metallopeptidase [Candidatus Dormibacteraeota bacterium]|nr:M56 family metallopeptidase [Candidatus Dormibacteraeota bacterium]
MSFHYDIAAQIIAWAVIYALWQGCAIALVTLVALRFLRHRTAEARYAFACAALLLMLLLPVASAFYSFDSDLPHISAPTAPPDRSHTIDARTGPKTARSVAGEITSTRIAGGNEPGPLQLLTPWISVLWAFGFVLSSTRFGMSWCSAWWICRRRASFLAEPEWQQRLARLSAKLGISRAITLMHSSTVEVPLVLGALKPVILLPIGLVAGLDVRQVEAILTHELAHVRRHDYLVNMLQAVAEAFLFFHPAAWWLSSAIRQEREHCCDDVAAAFVGDRRSYARALADLEGLRQSGYLAVGAAGGDLVRRVRRLLGPPGNHAQVSLLPIVLCLAIFATAGLVRGVHASNGGLVLTIRQFSPIGGEPLTTTAKAVAGPFRKPSVPRPQSSPVVLRGKYSRTTDGATVHLSHVFLSESGTRLHESTSVPAAKLQTSQGGLTRLVTDAGEISYLDSDNFEFSPNPRYTQQFVRLGYSQPSTDQLFMLAVHDVDLDLLQTVQTANLTASTDSLIAFRIHHGDSEFVRLLRRVVDSRASLDDATSLRIGKVDSTFLDQLAREGRTNLSVERIQALKRQQLQEGEAQ